ncbi:MAG: hypothetical protein PUK26_04660 [Lachnoclostridium sp.]|nr:hypothetical protein [Lachnoclostridium sp.]
MPEWKPYTEDDAFEMRFEQDGPCGGYRNEKSLENFLRDETERLFEE